MQHKPWVFKAGIGLKGINGALELLGGVLFLALSPSTIHRMVLFLTPHEPPGGVEGWIFRQVGRGLEEMNRSPAFAVFYLLSHGVVKLFLSIALLRGVRWAYPAALGVFGVLLGYEVCRFVIYPSEILGVVIGIDAAILVLIGIHGRAERPA